MSNFSLGMKLTASFSMVIMVGVFLSTTTGVRIIGNTIIKQAQDKVRLDLNSAREVYLEECENIKNIVRLTAVRFFLKDAIQNNNRESLELRLIEIMEGESLDILTLTDKEGRVIIRARNPMIYGDSPNDEIVNWVLSKNQTVVSTQIVTDDELEKEGEDLANKARIKLIPTPKARPKAEIEETSGMMIKAASPVLDYGGDLIGVLYGGILINRNYETVDKVKDIVYRGEQHKKKDIGTATIFQGDLRISTNVKKLDGSRAIGTQSSEEVCDQVIREGIPWIGRAFVVNAWYITAYEAIKNINGKIIGMLYVGMREQPYVDLKNRVVLTFLSIALLSIVLLSIIAYLTTINITRPIKQLLFATNEITKGNLSQRVQIRSHDEIGQLADSFNDMTTALQKATDNYLTLTKTLEKKVAEKTKELEQTQDYLIRSEKLTSLGRLAAGIAHEINNPLTAILINGHLIAEELKGDDTFKEKVELLIDETTRCSNIVKGLLEFSRQTSPEKIPADINKIIEKTLLLFASQILVAKVRVEKNYDKTVPKLMIDINKIEQVFTNVILNALDAMPDGGILAITTEVSVPKKSVEIKFTDTGCGIPKDNINKIFDPFFSTKPTKGTGLGLSVSYGIIRQHDGDIRVQSAPEKGTTITICLPINSKAKNT